MAFDSRNAKAQKKEFRAQCQAMTEPCWLCGQPIDYEAPPNTPDSFDLDHFYPQSTHPELAEDPANFRASHCSCNRSRKAGQPMPDLGTLSEAW